GGRGIGRGISELLAAQGAAVAINYHSGKEGAEETLQAILQDGGTAKIYGASVADYAESSKMVKEVIRDFGHIDILVNNAGIASRGKAVADTDAAEVEKLLAVHAVGAHQLCAAVLPSMRTQERGDIVFISSVATANNSAKGAPYNMGKAAMEALALTLAKEERKHGIRVNIAAPGLVETDMGVRLSRSLTGNKELTDLRSLDENAPFGHVCQPIDVANVVLWFCSPGSAYVTGQRVQCDGGGAISSY
ncbi:MAG: SDR family oxidoreductase, partial [Actinobacteria bacterium]|nr:SDR family oxidoreductase [Actinomycetota bacterium]